MPIQWKCRRSRLVAPVASIEAVLNDPESELEALIAEACSDTYVVDMEGYGAVYAAFQEEDPKHRRARSFRHDGGISLPEADANTATSRRMCHAAAFAFEMLSHWAQLHFPGAFSPSVSAKAPAADTVIPGPVSPADDAPIGVLDAHFEPTAHGGQGWPARDCVREESRTRSGAQFQ